MVVSMWVCVAVAWVAIAYELSLRELRLCEIQLRLPTLLFGADTLFCGLLRSLRDVILSLSRSFVIISWILNCISCTIAWVKNNDYELPWPTERPDLQLRKEFLHSMCCKQWRVSWHHLLKKKADIFDELSIICSILITSKSAQELPTWSKHSE